MALALFSRSSTRESALRAQVFDLSQRLNQRLSSPVIQDHDVFAGFGDSANARTTLEAVRGSTATAIRVIRQRVQGLEMGVFARRFINGAFEDSQLFDHRLALLLRNPTMAADGAISHTMQQLMGMTTTQYESLGESYWFVIRDGMGIPTQLQMARPGTLEPILGGGVIKGYRMTTGLSSVLTLKPTDVIRFWEPDPFELFASRGIMGKNVATIETDLFATARWRKFYQEDATPKLAYVSKNAEATLPTEEQQEQVALKFTQRFNRLFGKWAHRPAWVHPNWDIKQLSSEEEAASGVTMMTHLYRRVFQAFGVPSSLVGDVIDVNRAAAETSRFIFDQNTVEPITDMIADALTSQLASQYPVGDGVQLIVKFLPFISRDKAFELGKDAIDLQNKTRTINQVREARVPAEKPVTWGDLPVGSFADTPYTGEEEEIDLSGLSTVPAPEETEPVETEDEGEEERSRTVPVTRAHSLSQMRAHFAPELEWQRTIVRDEVFTPKFRAMQRSVFLQQGKDTLARFEATSRDMEELIARALERKAKDWGPMALYRAAADDLVAEIFPPDIWDDMFEQTTEVIRKQSYVASATEATEAITGKVFRLTDVAQQSLSKMDLSHIKFVNAQTQSLLKGQLRLGLANGESTGQMAARITNTFEIRRKDATRIARTEIATAVQEAQIEGYKQTGVVAQKQWNTSLDGDVRDSHEIEGQTRDLDDDFTLSNGSRAESPAGVSLPAGDRINCRCFVTPVFEGEASSEGLSFSESGVQGDRPEANVAGVS